VGCRLMCVLVVRTAAFVVCAILKLQQLSCDGNMLLIAWWLVTRLIPF
jgi:hypothetical protein